MHGTMADLAYYGGVAFGLMNMYSIMQLLNVLVEIYLEPLRQESCLTQHEVSTSYPV